MVRAPPGPLRRPNFVARTTSSRRPAMALPTSSSLMKAVYLSGVQERATELEGAVNRGDRLALVGSAIKGGGAGGRHAHAAKADGGDGQLPPKGALMHALP